MFQGKGLKGMKIPLDRCHVERPPQAGAVPKQYNLVSGFDLERWDMVEGDIDDGHGEHLVRVSGLPRNLCSSVLELHH